MREILNGLSHEPPSEEFLLRLRNNLISEAQTLEAPPSSLIERFAETSAEAPIIVDADWAQDARPFGLGAAARVAVAAAILAVALLSGLTLSTSRTGELETAAPPTPAPQPALVGAAPTQLAPGIHAVDTLGTEFEIHVLETSRVITNSEGLFELLEPASPDSRDRTIAITRISQFSDPRHPQVPFSEGSRTWPADDVFGWLDNLSDAFVIGGLQPAMVGDLPASRFDIFVADSSCNTADDCLFLASNHSATSVSFSSDEWARVWYVPQEDEDPILIVATNQSGVDYAWLSSIDRHLETITFSDVEPNPVLG